MKFVEFYTILRQSRADGTDAFCYEPFPAVTGYGSRSLSLNCFGEQPFNRRNTS